MKLRLKNESVLAMAKLPYVENKSSFQHRFTIPSLGATAGPLSSCLIESKHE